MCTSIVSNRKKTIIGWNLDLLEMEHKIRVENDKVYIAINDAVEGWLPLFGANARGDFVAMPTCWPFDDRSDPARADDRNIIKTNLDLLFERKTFVEIKQIAAQGAIFSAYGVTFQAQLSDRNGHVLQITPGQGYRYLPKPAYAVMTNFSPFKGNTEPHPWMGWDRYNTAVKMLEEASEDFAVKECFDLLKATAQNVCPTVVSMVFDVSENEVYWCENQDWTHIKLQKIGK